MRSSLGIGALTLFSSVAHADVLPPGHKNVSHEIYIRGLEKFPEYRFYLKPTTMTGGVADVVPGKALPYWYKFASPLLYAARKTDSQGGVVARSEETFYTTKSVLQADRTARIRTTYEITAIEGGVIKLRHLKDERLDRAGKPVREDKQVGDLPLLALSSLGLAALVVTRLRRL